MNLYNEEFKEEYISNFDNDSTQKTIRNIFKKSFSSEMILRKDLYDFSKDEIGDLIRGMTPFDQYIAYDLGKQIGRYIDYAIKCGRAIADNPVNAITFDWYKNLVDKKHKFFSQDEIYSLVERLVNGQDKAMVALIFEGVSGKDLCELRNIQISDVNQISNLITLKDENGEATRIIKVSDWCMKQVQSAIADIYYQSIKSKSEKQMVEFNNYLFRSFQNRTTEYNRAVLVPTIYYRIRNISDAYEIPYFRPRTIFKSGMIAMVVRLLGEGRYIKRKYLEEISDQFNYGKFYQEAYQDKAINVSYIKRTINTDEIKKLYGINIEFE